MDNIYHRQGHHHLKNDEVVQLHTFQSRLDIQSSSFQPSYQTSPTTAIMSSTLKRKPSPSEDESLVESSKRRFTETINEETAPSQDNDTTSSAAPTPTSGTDTSQADRLARFAALRNRNKSSRDDNRKATTLEVSRASADPGALASLSRRKERATEKLLHAQTLEDGDDLGLDGRGIRRLGQKASQEKGSS
jgi:hypothetical protein